MCRLQARQFVGDVCQRLEPGYAKHQQRLRQFLGNTYFIKGENSNYINQDNFEACDKYFPNNKLIEIKDAGHWVYADNPTTFLEKIQALL